MTSYANVLHRMAMGEEITGAELLTLPGYGGEPGVLGPMSYWIDMVPGLLNRAGELAAETSTPNDGENFPGAAELINSEFENHRYVACEPPPELIRQALWNIGCAADLAVRLQGID